jgi:hypothetical protein
MGYSVTTLPTTNLGLKAVAAAFGDATSNARLENYYDQHPNAGASHKNLGIFAGNIFVNITSNQTNFNLFSAAGSPTAQTVIFVFIKPGVYVYSTSTGTPGFNTGSGYHASTLIHIDNQGYMMGKGGSGGAGGNESPTTGGAGGDALNLGHDVEVVNASGYVFGGGGGGGGGGYMGFYGGWVGGGGGGGGAGSGVAGPAGTTATDCGVNIGPVAGSAGNFSTYGAGATNSECSSGAGGAYGGAGGRGGAFGASGVAGNASYQITCSQCYAPEPGKAAGGPGKAVDKNGNTITWISGNDGTHVKGAQT